MVGVDDDPLICELTDPPLSMWPCTRKRRVRGSPVAGPPDAGRENEGQIIPHAPSHVVSRQSTDTLAVEDPDVARAMVFYTQPFQRIHLRRGCVQRSRSNQPKSLHEFMPHGDIPCTKKSGRYALDIFAPCLLKPTFRSSRIRWIWNSPASSTLPDIFTKKRA